MVHGQRLVQPWPWLWSRSASLHVCLHQQTQPPRVHWSRVLCALGSWHDLP